MLFVTEYSCMALMIMSYRLRHHAMQNESEAPENGILRNLATYLERSLRDNIPKQLTLQALEFNRPKLDARPKVRTLLLCCHGHRLACHRAVHSDLRGLRFPHLGGCHRRRGGRFVLERGPVRPDGSRVQVTENLDFTGTMQIETNRSLHCVHEARADRLYDLFPGV